MTTQDSSRPLVIFGTGETAQLARYYFEHDGGRRVVAFTVDDDHADTDRFDGLPLVPFSRLAGEFPPAEADMFVALSYGRMNRLREEKFHQTKAAGYCLASYVCSRSVLWPDLSVGDNCFILENQTIQPTVTIGDNVFIWSGNHLGHGSSVGAHTYIASHVVISGHCRIGERCFIGVNATLKDFTTIGDDCFIAMDASITADMAAGEVAVAEGATIFIADDRRARFLKRQYFGV